MANTKTAQLVWTGEDWNFETTLGSGYQVQFKAPEPNATGGSPMEFLLAGVAGCTGVDVLSILNKMRQDVTGLTVDIEGDRAEDYPMVYTDVTIVYNLTGTDIDPDAVEKAIELSMTKYCSASIIFKRAGVKVSTTYHIETV
ncbi:MAG: OsmC family protein [Anaerolineae bacterium]|nr:OsmC family protein [Anaerolineae bacterium]